MSSAKEEKTEEKSIDYNFCEDCGKIVKNDKFDRCYICNMERRGIYATPCKSCGKKKDNLFYNCYDCYEKKTPPYKGVSAPQKTD